MTDTTPTPSQLVPPNIAEELIKEYGPLEFKTGEFCFNNTDKCFDRVNSNYAKVSNGIGVVVYKKTASSDPNEIQSNITTLLLPPETHIGIGYSKKCRANQAIALSVGSKKCDKIPIESSRSFRRYTFTYNVGKKVTPTKPFHDDNCFDNPMSSTCKHSYYVECAPGIHFFMNKKDAESFLF